MTIDDAIFQILNESDRPLHILEITEQIIEKNIYFFSAKNPPSSIGPKLYRDIKHDAQTAYVQTAKATFFLKTKFDALNHNRSLS
jgi:hypothetical protein